MSTCPNEALRIGVNDNNGVVEWMYYNPDSCSGGQYVFGTIGGETFLSAARDWGKIGMDGGEVFSDFVMGISDQYLIDRGTEEYSACDAEYLDFGEWVEFTYRNVRSICERIEKLQNSKKRC